MADKRRVGRVQGMSRAQMDVLERLVADVRTDAVRPPVRAGILRASVAGVLLCSRTPEAWLPNAVIMATRYRGDDRSTGQADAQTILPTAPV